MSQFPDASHAASWAGLCPGNQESAGKRFSGRTAKENRYLRRILVQSAWGASRKRNCSLASLFFRISRRHGRKKAAVAVAHRILIIAWSMLHNGVDYQERGEATADQLRPVRAARKLVSRLERIGFQVTVNRLPDKVRTAPRPAAPPGACRKCWGWGLADCIHVRPKYHKAEDRKSSSPANSTA